MGASKKMRRQDSNVKKCMKLPILILIRAKNLCMEGLTGGAGHMSYGNAMGCPTPIVSTLPRRSCTTSKREGDHHFKAKTDNKCKRADGELLRSKGVGQAVNTKKIAPIGRIDEEEEFEYDGENVGLLSPNVCWTSKTKSMLNKSPLLSVMV